MRPFATVGICHSNKRLLFNKAMTELLEGTDRARVLVDAKTRRVGLVPGEGRRLVRYKVGSQMSAARAIRKLGLAHGERLIYRGKGESGCLVLSPVEDAHQGEGG